MLHRLPLRSTERRVQRYSLKCMLGADGCRRGRVRVRVIVGARWNGVEQTRPHPSAPVHTRTRTHPCHLALSARIMLRNSAVTVELSQAFFQLHGLLHDHRLGKVRFWQAVSICVQLHRLLLC
jgi:hypothetical protein